jgi:hypothetical protein
MVHWSLERGRPIVSVIILEWSARVTSDLDLESSVTRCLYFREERVSAICPPVISFVFVSNLFCQMFAAELKIHLGVD